MKNVNALAGAGATALGTLPRRRPRLLVEAARIGAGMLLRKGCEITTGRRAKLAEEEETLEMLRQIASPAWRPGRHVELLAALFAAESQPAPQTKASGSAALRAAM